MRVNGKHSDPVETVKMTEGILDEMHAKQILELENALVKEKEQVLHKMGKEIEEEKRNSLKIIQDEYLPQYQFLQEKKKNGLLEAEDHHL